MRRNAAFIASYLFRQKWRYALSALTVIALITIHLAMTAMQGVIVDDLFMQGRYDLILPILFLFGGLILANSFVYPAAYLLMARNEFQARTELAGDLLASLHRTPIGILQKERSARYVQLITNDVSQVAFHICKTFIVSGLGHLVRIAMLATYIGMASPVILAAVCALSVAYFFMARYFSPKMKAMVKAVQESRGELLVSIEEAISASREIIAFHRARWEQLVYHRRFGRYFESVIAEGKLENKQLAAGEPLKWAMQLIILTIGGLMVIRGNMALGVFIVTIQFSSDLTNAINFFFKFILGLSGTMGHVERVREAMEGERIDDGTEPLRGNIEHLALRELEFRYGEEFQKVLNGVTLDIPIGKKVAFVGSSGGGKSTIAQLLVRFFPPQSGRITVNGTPLSHIRRVDWSNRVAIVFQEPYLFPDTIRNNLRFGREELSDGDLVEMCKRMLIHDFVMSLPDGYDTEIGERGILLSGGQRQRIALARELLGDPELLILDEATSALDPYSERIIQQEIDERRRGKTTVVIAHRLSTVRNADLLFVMEDGRVVEEGSHDELLAKGGLYFRLFHTQEADSHAIAAGTR
jgi:ABC-type multidrug transport system fused ATPase/permease subunit